MTDRPRVLWFGRPPSPVDLREAKNRHLKVEVVGHGSTPSFIYARAAIFWATSQHFEAAVEDLEANLAGAVDHGLFVLVVVDGELNRREISQILEKALPAQEAAAQCQIRVNYASQTVESHEAFHVALTHNPGPAAKAALRITALDDTKLSDGQVLLLQRAFHDCDWITLTSIKGGFSGALTLLIYAKLSTSFAGSKPLPFFAKLDTFVKARQEIQKFAQYAEHHIRWYLRPNFIAERCIFGVREGILVGSFVDASKSLWETVCAGEGPRHVRSLFKETLHGLRHDSHSRHMTSVVEPLASFCDHTQIPPERVEAAKALGGLVYEARSLWRKLISLPAEQWRACGIHGDMHGENARVRKDDVIVIDFTHAATGPMCADLASLDVWLAFKMVPDSQAGPNAWRAWVDAMYRPETIELNMTGRALDGTEDVVAPCLLEIRQLAKECTASALEYQRVLALYLLRCATFPPDASSGVDDESRRTCAYWLANRLILALTDESQTQPVSA